MQSEQNEFQGPRYGDATKPSLYDTCAIGSFFGVAPWAKGAATGQKTLHVTTLVPKGTAGMARGTAVFTSSGAYGLSGHVSSLGLSGCQPRQRRWYS